MTWIPLPDSIPERSVPEILEARAASAPDRTALLASSAVDGPETRLSYAELLDRASRMAAMLAERGVGKGDRVGILLDNESAIEAHVTYHAAHRLGAINVPLNTRYVPRELSYVLDFIEPSAVIHAAKFASLVDGVSGSLAGTALLEAEAGITTDAGMERTPVAEDDDADWIFTSGTTGKPKAVALTHGGSVACGYQSRGLWGMDETSVYQSFAPFFTSTGCHTNLLSALAAGCTYAIEEEFDVRGTLERMQRYGTTSIFLINTVLNLIFARLTPEEIAALEFPALRRVCYGAQPSTASFYERVAREIGEGWDVELVNVYGLTEGGTSGIMLIPEDHDEALPRVGSFGLSIGRTGFSDWVEHAVLRDDGTPVEPDEIGELCLRGPSTMSRYVRNEEATARALRHGWLYTGDLATVDDAGFVYYVDRNKQLIRRGGLNISSAEVEAVLAEHPAVLEVAAVPLPNPVLGADVRCVVALHDGAEATEQDLVAFARERLADYKVPRVVDFVDALPRNAMGRVTKGVLVGEEASLT